MSPTPSSSAPTLAFRQVDSTPRHRVGDIYNSLQRLVATTEASLFDDDISGLPPFVIALDDARRSLDNDAWRTVIDRVVAPHVLRRRLHEDPFARHAFEKPRGYPGDAGLIDLIYQGAATLTPLTPLGARLHEWGRNQPACCSVRERRRVLAALIDRVAAERARPRVLSLACGHLREAQSSEAVQAHAINELVAIDQDVRSLSVVDREQRSFNVTPIHGSVRRFLMNPLAHGTFDLVYSAGLYDYLADRVTASLTRAMFDALRPGGVLLVANFAPELREIGYMEAIMDWNLIYRDELEVSSFASKIPCDEIAEMRLERDSSGNVVYLTIRKR